MKDQADFQPETGVKNILVGEFSDTVNIQANGKGVLLEVLKADTAKLVLENLNGDEITYEVGELPEYWQCPGRISKVKVATTLGTAKIIAWW